MTDTAKVGEIGVPLIITTSFDLEGYSRVELQVTKPSGTVDIWSPTVTTVSTGVLTYETVSGDLDEPGKYRVQPYIEFSDGDKRYGDAYDFIVLSPGDKL